VPKRTKSLTGKGSKRKEERNYRAICRPPGGSQGWGNEDARQQRKEGIVGRKGLLKVALTPGAGTRKKTGSEEVGRKLSVEKSRHRGSQRHNNAKREREGAGLRGNAHQ